MSVCVKHKRSFALFSPLSRAFSPLYFNGDRYMRTLTSRTFTPAELFARARRLEAEVGIGNRAIYCSQAVLRYIDCMPNSSVACSSHVVR